MRRIVYPNPIHKFKKEYWDIFKENLPKLQRTWIAFRNNNKFLRTHLPKNVKRIILADYDKLVRYYIAYKKECHLTEDEKKDLKAIFNYDSYQPAIARFFMNKAEELSINTCFYCETAYINVYTDGNPHLHLYELNTAPDEVFKKLLNTESDKTLNRMKRSRPFLSIEHFNNIWERGGKKCKPNKFESIYPTDFKNHFDLDHALDKGACPLVGLSIMNFVPSCPTCNEKLKRSKILGNPDPLEYLSPTSTKYDFDGNVKIRVAQFGTYGKPLKALDPAYALDYSDTYYLRFEFKRREYETIVDTFKLHERYAFHKLEGLHWLVRKSKYTDANIKMIAQTLMSPLFTEYKIKEDLFQLEYDRKRHPCFSKFKRDILS